MAQQLQDLAKQLALQMDYNNELLGQLQSLEEAHLAYEKKGQERQTALRSALSVADAARAEATDAKRKHAVSQELTNRLSDEVKELRVDNGILKRQLEALEKLALEAKNDITGLRDERGLMLAQVGNFSSIEPCGHEFPAYV
jgi:chromosome segregation ATPase